jgi:hypothetical protein
MNPSKGATGKESRTSATKHWKLLLAAEGILRPHDKPVKTILGQQGKSQGQSTAGTPPAGLEDSPINPAMKNPRLPMVLATDS